MKTTSRQRKAFKARYERLKSEGRCVVCCVKHDRGTGLCATCAKKQSAASHKAQKRRREFRLTNGLCVQCGGKPIDGMRHCLSCLKKSSHKPHGAWKQLGLCVTCGKKRTEHPSHCDQCLVERRTDMRKRSKRRFAKMLGKGLCYQCGNPVAPGKTKCRRHLDIEARRLATKYYARKALRLCVRGCGRPCFESRMRCKECTKAAKERYANNVLGQK